MGNLADIVMEQVAALRRYAILLSGDRRTADALVQDVLESAMEQLDGAGTVETIRTELFRILYSRCRDDGAIARPSKRPAGALAEVLPLSPRKPAMTPIEAALGELAFAERAVLLLVSVERFSYEQIALILTIPVASVASEVVVARKALQALLEPPEAPEGVVFG